MQVVDAGDRIISGKIEAYSCKLAGGDKRAAKEISHALEASLSSSPAYSNLLEQPSPLGDLHEPATKQLLVSLITTMNASFSDYDFRNLRPEDFERIVAPQIAINEINSLFLTQLESLLSMPGFRAELWSALEETVLLHEGCEIFKYEPDEDSDLHDGRIWQVNYFFFNRKLKKMVLLSGEAASKLQIHQRMQQQDDTDRLHRLAARRVVHHTPPQRSQNDTTAEEMQVASSDDEDDDDTLSDEEDEDENGRIRGGDDDVDVDGDDDMVGVHDETLSVADVQPGPAGSYVDVSLLEWDGIPGESGIDASGESSALQSNTHSPSLSSTQTTATIPIVGSFGNHAHLTQPVAQQQQHSPSFHPSHPHPHQPPATATAQMRLASTKSPILRPVAARAPLPPLATSTTTATGTAATQPTSTPHGLSMFSSRAQQVSPLPPRSPPYGSAPAPATIMQTAQSRQTQQ